MIGDNVDHICDGRVGDDVLIGGLGTDSFAISSSLDQFTDSNPLEGDYAVDCESHEIIYSLIEVALLLLQSAELQMRLLAE